MSTALLSDVHANFTALRAVMADIETRGNVQQICFVGDAVGYGPEPNECILHLMQRCKHIIAGNHDWGAVGLSDTSRFNSMALDAINWTARALTSDVKKTLKSLPAVKVLDDLDMMLVHGAPMNPEQWGYVLSAGDMTYCFDHFKQRICITGHTHIPYITELNAEGSNVFHGGKTGGPVELTDGSRFLINPGSVGQPRDQDARASYAIIDDSRVEIIRVQYDIKRTQKKMQEADLPVSLSERIAYGF